jgi:hypothetical protein
MKRKQKRTIILILVALATVVTLALLPVLEYYVDSIVDDVMQWRHRELVAPIEAAGAHAHFRWHDRPNRVGWWVRCGDLAIDDDAFETIAPLIDALGVNFLMLGDTRITDKGLAAITPLKDLKLLDLRQTRVGDAGIERLGDLPLLEGLFLAGTNVTEAGLRSFLRRRKTDSLKVLSVSEMSVSREGANRLKADYPGLLVLICPPRSSGEPEKEPENGTGPILMK